MLTSLTSSTQGKWQLAESVFNELEAEALGHQLPSCSASSTQPGKSQAAQPANPASAAPGSNLWTAAELNGALPAGLGSDFSSGGGGSGSARSTASSPVPIAGAGDFNPLESYGLLPTTLAEQVRRPPAVACSRMTPPASLLSLGHLVLTRLGTDLVSQLQHDSIATGFSSVLQGLAADHCSTDCVHVLTMFKT